MKVHLFSNGIVNIVMIICITIVAIHFDMASILWFYIIPFFGMGDSSSEKPKSEVQTNDD